MSYLDTIEQDIRKIVKTTAEDKLVEELNKYVKRMVVESFRNGIQLVQVHKRLETIYKNRHGRNNK